MSKEFVQSDLENVYRSVLGISCVQVPPDYFQLLGIERYESDVAKIEDAARQRSQALQKLLGTEKERAARIILRQLSKAKVCLLDPQARQAYQHNLAPTEPPNPASHHKSQSAFSQKPEQHATSPEVLAKLPPLAQSETDLLLNTFEPPTRMPKLRPRGRSGQQGKRTSGSRPNPTGPEQRSIRIQKQLPLISVGIAILVFSALAVILFSMLGAPPLAGNGAPTPEQPLEDDTQPVPQDDPQPVPQDDPQPVPQDDTQPVPQDDTQPVPQDDPQPVPQDDPQPVPQDDPQPVPQDDPQPVPQDDPQPVPQDDPQPVPPPAGLHPLSTLPVAVSLPDFSPSDSTIKPNAGEPFEIGTLQGPATTAIECRLRMAAANLAGNQAFQLVKSARKTFVTAWVCRATRSLSSGGTSGSSDPIALFYVKEDNVLRFKWAVGARTAVAGQLRNTVLEFSVGQQRHEIRLRPVVSVNPLTLNFHQRIHEQEIAKSSLPISDNLFLEVTRLDDFDVACDMKPADGRAAFGEEVVLQLQDWEGAEIRVRHAGRKDEPKIIIASVYQVGKNWRPLTNDALEKQRNKMQEIFQNNLVKLNSVPDALKDAYKLHASLKRSLSATRNPRVATQLTGQIMKLQRHILSLEGTANRLKKSIPRTKEAMDHFSSLLEVIGRLNGKARIHFRFAAKTAEGDFDLLTTDDLAGRSGPGTPMRLHAGTILSRQVDNRALNDGSSPYFHLR